MQLFSWISLGIQIPRDTNGFLSTDANPVATKEKELTMHEYWIRNQALYKGLEIPSCE